MKMKTVQAADVPSLPHPHIKFGSVYDRVKKLKTDQMLEISGTPEEMANLANASRMYAGLHRLNWVVKKRVGTLYIQKGKKDA